MEYRRNIEIYGDYFADFYDKQSPIVRRKINYVLNLVRTEEQIPAKFLKSIEGGNGLFEIRVEIEGNIFRIFCCFDEGKLVILFNGYQKKSQKAPAGEIKKAQAAMRKYLQSKKEVNNE